MHIPTVVKLLTKLLWRSMKEEEEEEEKDKSDCGGVFVFLFRFLSLVVSLRMLMKARVCDSTSPFR